MNKFMNKIYPAFFFNEGADTVCIFPDFDGMSTYGTGRTEALAMAVDALVGTLSLMILDGQDLPTPSNFTSADAKRIAEKYDLSSTDGELIMVSVDPEAYIKNNLGKSVRKSVTIPEWMDKRAKEKHLNLSHVLQAGIRAELGLS